MNIIKKLLVYGSLLVSTVAAAQETVTRKLSSFNKLDVGGSFEVVMEKGNEESVKITAEGVSPDKIITEVKSNTLDVHMERGNYNNIKVHIYITYKSLDEINKSGSGNLTCNSELGATDFNFVISGSGNTIVNKKIAAKKITISKSGSGTIKLNALETEDADFSFSGSGNFEIAGGHATKQSIHLTGSGNVSTYGVKSNECSASISGSGSIEVSVSQSLQGKIAGSGNITYKGDAQVTKTGIIGSGRINRKS